MPDAAALSWRRCGGAITPLVDRSTTVTARFAPRGEKPSPLRAQLRDAALSDPSVAPHFSRSLIYETY